MQVLSVATVGVALFAGAASASPLFTTVSNPAAGPSHADLIATIIDGPFGVGSLGSLRVADELDGASPISFLGNLGVSDQSWAGGVEITVTTVATGDDDVSFGLEQQFDGQLSPAPASPLMLLNAADGLGASATLTPGPEQFGWILQNRTTRQTLRGNGTPKDAFVTYDLSGLVAGADQAFLVLFDERLVDAAGFDGDYNDFGVLVTTIPSPAAFLTLAAGVGGIAARRRR